MAEVRREPPILKTVFRRKSDFPDWIISCLWTGVDRAAVLTAHNRVHLVGLQEDEGEDGDAAAVDCEEKCILYSGLLLQEGNGDVVVLAGTVFREIVIWRGGGGGGLGSQDRPVLHRLTGHQGVIFSLEFSRDLSLLCSTSDDRTARTWTVSFPADPSPSSSSSSSGRGERDWSAAEIIPGVTLRGHTARVFRSVFVGPDLLATAGEDGTIIVWDAAKGVKVEEKRARSPVWSLACDREKKQGTTLFSGGEQGLVRSWRVSMESVLSPREVEQFWSEGDPPRVIRTHESTGSLLCLTLKGAVFRFSGDSLQAERVLYLKELEKHALMEVQREEVIFATLCGKIMVWKWNGRGGSGELARHQVFRGKVFSLHVVGSEPRCLACGAGGRLRMVDGRTGAFLQEMTLPARGEQRWPSCAAIDGDFLYLGDRSGYLHVYNARTGQILFSAKAHGNHGVGDIAVRGRLLQTVGRNGLQNTFRISEPEGEGHLSLASRSRLPLPWVDSFFPYRGDVLLLGFRASCFVGYSCREQRDVVEVVCGGGHRSWDFSTRDEEGTRARFAFVKDQRLYTVDIPILEMAKSELRPGLHAKKICVACHFSIGRDHYIATGGEDGVIKIHDLTWNADRDVWERVTLETLRSHISSVKCLKTVQDGEAALLMVSAGGRAELKAWGIEREAAHAQGRRGRGSSKGRLLVTELATHLLKGGDKKRKKVWRNFETVYDTEVRFVDIEITRGAGAGFVVYVGCSDGVLRALQVDPASRRIHPLAESDSINHCFLRLAPRRCEGEGVLTCSTDGFIRSWSLGGDDGKSLVPEWEVQANTSGINSLTATILAGGGRGGGGEEGEELILSGDDGGVLAVVGVEEEGGGRRRVVRRRTQLHAAQMTGLWTTTATTAATAAVVSCSVDQRVAAWTLWPDGRVELAGQLLTDVADAQSMCAWAEGDDGACNVVVAGEGLVAVRIRMKSH